MNLDFVDLWENNKKNLEEYFRTTKQKEYDSYFRLVELIIYKIINKYNEDEIWDTSKITVIDDGDYQGTQIFIIPKDTYQPSFDQYLVTYVVYGSCSGCDTLQIINSYEDDLPTEEQVKDYMTLCLHLLQHMKYLTQ